MVVRGRSPSSLSLMCRRAESQGVYTPSSPDADLSMPSSHGPAWLTLDALIGAQLVSSKEYWLTRHRVSCSAPTFISFSAPCNRSDRSATSLPRTCAVGASCARLRHLSTPPTCSLLLFCRSCASQHLQHPRIWTYLPQCQ
jgi:hypothetical protein